MGLGGAKRDAADVLLIADDPQAGREVAALADEHDWQVEPETATDDAERWRVRRR